MPRAKQKRALPKRQRQKHLKTRRVKELSLPLVSSARLQIKARRFHTNKARRSKTSSSLVLPIPFSPYKEIAFIKVRGKASHSRAVWIRQPAAVTLAMIIVGFVGFVFFLGLSISSGELKPPVTPTAEAQEVSQSKKEQPPAYLPKSDPVWLSIAKVGIDTKLSPVGKQADGSMEVPKVYDSAGWYKYAPTPGEKGPAVIVGHVDKPGGIAVFWRLRELTPGDTFDVGRADGRTVTFTVTEVKQFPQDSFPTAEVYGNLEYAGIRLITCGGTFDRAARQYSHNTVVYGVMNKP